MDLVEGTIFMIRNGDFGSNFETKFFVFIAAIIVSLLIWKIYKKKDYFWVYVTGTIIWAILEFSVQYIGVRAFNPVTLFGIPISLPIVALLRGAAEGGVVAFGGLVITDLLINKKTRLFGAILTILTAVVLTLGTTRNALPQKIIGGLVSSRRDMFSIGEIITFSIAIIVSIYWIFVSDKKTKNRAILLLIVMTILSGVWTIASVISNMRWIEVVTNGVLVEAPLILSFLALFYDCLVEIGFMYLPFFFIPYFLGLLDSSPKKKQKSKVISK
jgi:hypothetical protein